MIRNAKSKLPTVTNTSNFDIDKSRYYGSEYCTVGGKHTSSQNKVAEDIILCYAVAPEPGSWSLPVLVNVHYKRLSASASIIVDTKIELF